jgi:glutamate--cysteine ligase
MVPHLITALASPINELEQRILESMPAIERWFRLEWMEHTPPFYSAVDVRNAGYKLAPVATNLFPGGFNNLTPQMLPLAVQAAMAAIEKICPEAKNLLLIPEQGNRNSFYLQNLQQLMRVFNQAGLNVRLGSLDEDITAPTTLSLPDGGELELQPLKRSRGRLGLKDFDPCTILLNDSMTAGVPQVLKNLHEQYLLPPLHAGWVTRRKSNHFKSYEEVAKKFAKLLGMDPWLINPMSASCGEVDFTDGTGLDNVRTQVDALLTKVRRKHKEYGISDKPFVVIKADNGSGLGLKSVADAKELDDPELRERCHRHAAEHGPGVAELIVQEGVPTCERVNQAVAEPVVYMIDRYVVGGFYRVRPEQGGGATSNGSPDASYVPLAFAESHHLPKPGERPGASAPNRFYMYGVIGRLAMLAASYELEATDPDAEVYE